MIANRNETHLGYRGKNRKYKLAGLLTESKNLTPISQEALSVKSGLRPSSLSTCASAPTAASACAFLVYTTLWFSPAHLPGVLPQTERLFPRASLLLREACLHLFSPVSQFSSHLLSPYYFLCNIVSNEKLVTDYLSPELDCKHHEKLVHSYSSPSSHCFLIVNTCCLNE